MTDAPTEPATTFTATHIAFLEERIKDYARKLAQHLMADLHVEQPSNHTILLQRLLLAYQERAYHGQTPLYDALMDGLWERVHEAFNERMLSQAVVSPEEMRWKNAVYNIVTMLHGPRTTFDIPVIMDEVRKQLAVAKGAAEVYRFLDGMMTAQESDRVVVGLDEAEQWLKLLKGDLPPEKEQG